MRRHRLSIPKGIGLILEFRVFNVGSPYNNIAGHRARTLEEVVAVYEKQRADEQERTLKVMAEKGS